MQYTKNTLEVRRYLELKGFKGLSFYQDKEFVIAYLTTWANKHGEWNTKDYHTFDEKDKERMALLNSEASDFKEFKIYVENLTSKN